MTYRNPFGELQDELEQMLDGAFGPSGSWGVHPRIDVFDAGEAFVLKAEVPGIDPGDIEVTIEDDTVTLRGERASSGPEKDVPERDAAYHRRERRFGRLRRVVRMPGRLAHDEARAECRNGVLTVRIPKAKESRPRRVAVQAA
jgi:HSP20 family protein